jgi:predicted secreted protein
MIEVYISYVIYWISLFIVVVYSVSNSKEVRSNEEGI